MIRHWLRYAWLACWLLAQLPGLAESYEVDVHEALSLKIVDRSQTLDIILRDELGFPEGRARPFAGQPARFWVPRGSRQEDVPDLRVFNHFHNPLLPLDQAGLRTTFLGLTIAAGQSSLLWQQNPAQPASSVTFLGLTFDSGGEDRPWQRARREYLQALTGQTTGERDQAFRETFLGLGHVMHLIQDATVPAHVRNDPHPTRTFRLGQADERRIPIDPDPYEHWVMHTLRLNRSLFDALTDGTPPGGMPDLSAFSFSGTPVAGAPVPIARLIDTGAYRLTINPAALGDGAMVGIAEYTNGNYLSKDTRFRRFTHPAVSSLGPRSADPDLFVAQPGGSFRQYFAKESAGAPVRPFVMEGALHLSLQAATGLPPGFEGWWLDDKIHEAYASKLLPRAVGYSTALLDYFFRGKLDAEFVEDPLDENRMRLDGSLVSTEAPEDFRLDGTVAVYAEDSNGRRTALAPAVAVAGTAPQLTEVSVPRNDTASRFVAVYQGTLGKEERHASSNFAGAVVGKVFESPRVEEVYLAGGRWQLRTPIGVFPLPITQEIEDLRWGDVDNTLIGRTALGPGALNKFRAYRINRPVGSSQIPTRTEDGQTVVDVIGIRPDPQNPNIDRELVDALSLGTTVVFKGTHQFAYDHLTFEGRQPILYDPFSNDYFTWPILTDLDGMFDSAGPMEVTPKARVTVSVDTSFPIRLDRSRYNAPGAPLYSWTLREIGLDASGRTLAVVEVVLTQPPDNSQPVTIEVKDRLTGNPRPFFDNQPFVSVSFPIRTLLFALVDVSAGGVVASTATALVNLATDRTQTLTLIQKGVTDTVSSGPRSGQDVTLWEFTSPLDASEPGSLPEGVVPTVTGMQSTADGPRALSLNGWYRPEISAQVYSHVSFPASTRERSWVYAIVKPAGEGQSHTHLAYTQTETSFTQNGYVTSLRDAQRQRPGTAGEQLLLFSRPIGVSLGDEGVLVTWKPATQQAALTLPDPLSPSEGHRLRGTTTKRALVVSDSTSRLVDFERRTTEDFFGDDLSNRFVLLDPTFLYHVQDLRFHRPRPEGLLRTGLPAKLFPLDPNPIGDYHLIRSP